MVLIKKSGGKGHVVMNGLLLLRIEHLEWVARIVLVKESWLDLMI